MAEQNPEFAPFARDILDNKRIKPNRRVFDTKKVSDHFAIIPTGKMEKLTGDAQKLFEMVMARFLAVFFPAAVFEDTRRTTLITHQDGVTDAFLTTGRVLVEPGWQAVYGRKAGTSSKEELVPVRDGEQAALREIEIRNAMTKPPARYNEATLLAAMEGAGKLVHDEELAAAMSERGLGTPATRASIIEGLISQEYIVRDGRELLATRRGIELIALLERIGLKTLTSPSLTGEWEYKLKQMEQAALPRDSFMEGIKTLTGEIVKRVKDFREAQQQVELPEMELDCPSCHAHGLKNTLDAVSCRSCKFSIRKVISGRDMADEELKTLIVDGRTGILHGFTSRFGKPFEAGLELNDKFRATLYFPAREEDEAAGVEEAVKVASVAIPDMGEHDVMETAKAWKIPSLTLGKEHAAVSVSRTILGREIPLDQVLKILAEGKSDLMKGFISQRTKRPFDAYLVFNAKTGKIGFEFPPRERKYPAKNAAGKTEGKAEKTGRNAAKTAGKDSKSGGAAKKGRKQ